MSGWAILLLVFLIALALGALAAYARRVGQRFGGNIGDQHMKDLELEPEKRTSDDE